MSQEMLWRSLSQQAVRKHPESCMGENADRWPCRGLARGIAWATGLLLVAAHLVAVARADFVPPAMGQERAPARPLPTAPAAEVQEVAIVLAREQRTMPPPLSLLDFPPEDDGVAGG